MLLKFFGMSEPSAATKRRRNCRARSEGELLRFESVVVGYSHERDSFEKIASTYRPYPGLQ